MPVQFKNFLKVDSTEPKQFPPHNRDVDEAEKRRLFDEVYSISMDKNYLWYAKWSNRTPCGDVCFLPKKFQNWFPCENIVEPLGWNIAPHQETFYMMDVSIPEKISSQTLTMTGIIDTIDKEVELWLLRWYNSFHARYNVNSNEFNSNHFFHHSATLSEFARLLTIVRLTPKRNEAYSVSYFVTPRSDMQLSLNYTSGPKKIDALNLDIHGKRIESRQNYIHSFFESLFAR